MLRDSNWRSSVTLNRYSGVYSLTLCVGTLALAITGAKDLAGVSLLLFPTLTFNTEQPSSI